MTIELRKETPGEGPEPTPLLELVDKDAPAQAPAPETSPIEEAADGPPEATPKSDPGAAPPPRADLRLDLGEPAHEPAADPSTEPRKEKLGEGPEPTPLLELVDKDGPVPAVAPETHPIQKAADGLPEATPRPDAGPAPWADLRLDLGEPGKGPADASPPVPAAPIKLPLTEGLQAGAAEPFASPTLHPPAEKDGGAPAEASNPNGATRAPEGTGAFAKIRSVLRQLKDQHGALDVDLGETKQERADSRSRAKRARTQTKARTEIERHRARMQVLGPRMGLDPARPVTEIPPIPGAHLNQVEFQTIQEGRSFVRILFDSVENRYHYEVIEPQLLDIEKRTLDFIRETLVRTLEPLRRQEGQDWPAYLTEAVEHVILDHSILIDEVGEERALYYIVRDFFGYGEIDVLMRDPMIEDISCDGPGIPIYLFHRQYQSLKTNVVFSAERELDSYVVRLAQRSQKHISIADPLLDATLPDGSRLQASLSREVTARGSTFTVRKFRSDPLTPTDLVRVGTMSPEMAAYFWLAMEEGMSMVFGGGTASGKTTSLNACGIFIPPDKKVVSIEDTREINLRHENWIAGLTRSGFGGEVFEGKVAGTIDMYKLLEAALRQRPEYLIVGEVRGPEAMTLFQAMATGHATYSTLHADSVSSAVYRLENPPIRVPRIMLQTLDAILIQIQARINQRFVRRIKEVVEVTGFDPRTGDLLTNAVFRWDPATDTFHYFGKSHILEQIRQTNNLSTAAMEKEWTNRTRIMKWLADNNLRHIDAVAGVVSEYYRRPEVLMAKIEADPKGIAAGPNGTVAAVAPPIAMNGHGRAH